MLEYKKTFLGKMKALLFYFVKFNKDRSILSKDYFKDYAVSRPNERIFIMITNYQSTFLVNNR